MQANVKLDFLVKSSCVLTLRIGAQRQRRSRVAESAPSSAYCGGKVDSLAAGPLADRPELDDRLAIPRSPHGFFRSDQSVDREDPTPARGQLDLCTLLERLLIGPDARDRPEAVELPPVGLQVEVAELGGCRRSASGQAVAVAFERRWRSASAS